MLRSKNGSSTLMEEDWSCNLSWYQKFETARYISIKTLCLLVSRVREQNMEKIRSIERKKKITRMKKIK